MPSKASFFSPQQIHKEFINVMIRVFCAFGKTYFNKISDLSLFNQFMDSFNAEYIPCPSCGARHSCSNFAFYPRNIISYDEGSVVCNIISVPRVECSSCDSTHAILPDILIPHGSYSLSFILKVLRAYFLGKRTVVSLCSHFQISVSTLYAWIHLFKKQKSLWLGILKNAQVSSHGFLNLILSDKTFTDSFHSTFKISFMQNFKTTLCDSS
jgi:hypothetical protein